MQMVFREVALTWRGQEFRLVPSLALMRRLEAQDISLPALVESFKRKEPRMAQLAYVLATCLTEAGCRDVSEDAMFGALTDQARQGEAIALATVVFRAFFPEVGDPKKPAAPGETANPAAA